MACGLQGEATWMHTTDVCCWAKRGGPDINAAGHHLGGQRQTLSRPHSLLWWNKGHRSLQNQFPSSLSSGIHSCFCLSQRHLLIIPYLPGAERNSDRSAPCSVTGDTGMLSSLLSSMRCQGRLGKLP